MSENWLAAHMFASLLATRFLSSLSSEGSVKGVVESDRLRLFHHFGVFVESCGVTSLEEFTLEGNDCWRMLLLELRKLRNEFFRFDEDLERGDVTGDNSFQLQRRFGETGKGPLACAGWGFSSIHTQSLNS